MNSENTEQTMSEQTSTEQPKDQTPEAPAEAQHETDDKGASKLERAKAEAIRYRRTLRETETERDTLSEQVASLRRQIVERELEGKVTPDAFWAAGNDAAALFQDDGTVNADALTTAIEDTRARFHISSTPKPDPSQGAHGVVPGSNTWERAFDLEAR